MDMELVKTKDGVVVRPLQVLAKLIKEDLRNAKEAADEAAAPYYQGVADKMVEARKQQTYAETISWAHRNFDFSESQSQRYIKLGKDLAINIRGRGHKSMSDALRATGERPRGAAYGGVAWKEPVREILGRVNVEALKQDALAKQEERALQRKLALSLIDIGYKALATKLHPDKGGSREAMMRLNRVRDILRAAVSS